MSDFKVEVDKLEDLTSQLDDIHSDARAGANFVEDHARLSLGNEGLILAALAGSTAHAYEVVHGGLKALDQLCSDLATAVDEVRNEYLERDDEGRAEFDDSWASRLESGLPPEDSWPPSAPLTGPAFHSPYDPAGSYFKACPSAADAKVEVSFDPMKDLFSLSSWARPTLVQLVGWDPFEYWCRLLSGDWEAYTKAGVVWSRVSDAAPEFADNLAKAAVDTEEVWQGNAAEQFVRVIQLISGAMDHFGASCALFDEEFANATEAAKDLYEALAGVAGQIADYIIVLGISANAGTSTAPTLVGAVGGSAVASYSLYQIHKLLEEAQSLIGTAKNVVNGVSAAVSTVNSSGIDEIELPDAG